MVGLHNFSEDKKSFYRFFNAIFGRGGCIAKENVTVELLMKKCYANIIVCRWSVPVEHRWHQSSRLRCRLCSQDLKKIVDTNSKDIIFECRLMFDLNSIGDILLKRQHNFIITYWGLDNNLIFQLLLCLRTHLQNCAALTNLLSLFFGIFFTNYLFVLPFGEIKLNI